MLSFPALGCLLNPLLVCLDSLQSSFSPFLPPRVPAPWGISLSSTPSLVSVHLRMPPRGHCSCFWLSLSFPSPPPCPPPHVSDAFSPGLGLDPFLTPPPLLFLQPLPPAFYPNSFSLLALCGPSPHPSFSLFSSFLPINNFSLLSLPLRATLRPLVTWEDLAQLGDSSKPGSGKPASCPTWAGPMAVAPRGDRSFPLSRLCRHLVALKAAATAKRAKIWP